MNDSGTNEELYDEFGNYIGPDLASSSDEEDSDDDDHDDDSDDGNDDDNDNDEDETEENNRMIIDTNMNINMNIDTNMNMNIDTTNPSSAIVLHEDKVHYPSASTIYGPNVTTAVIDEDAMDIETPIIPPPPKPSATANFEIPTSFASSKVMSSMNTSHQIVSDEYLVNLLSNPTTITRRGVAFCGNLHTGKTSLIDLLLSHTTTLPSSTLPKFYTNILETEIKHKMTVQSTPITLPLSNTKGKTYAFTIVDNPGHTQFHDENVASLKLVDGCVLILNIIEGVTMSDTMIVKQCIQEGIPMVLVLNHMDKLIMDLKLPPEDAFMKIRHVIEELNLLVKSLSPRRNGNMNGNGNGNVQRLYPTFCPTRNVVFSSALHGFIFSLSTMAEMYVDHAMAVQDEEDEDTDVDSEDDNDNDPYSQPKPKLVQYHSLGKNLTVEEFTKRTWGNCYLDPMTNTFQPKASKCTPTKSTPTIQRTFCQFVLEPLYKLYSCVLGESEKDLNKTLRGIGIHLSKDQLRSNSNELLQIVMKSFYGNGRSLVDMIVTNVPTPAAAALGKISRCYTGPINTPVAKAMRKCDPNGPLMIHVTKLYPNINPSNGSTGQSFSVFGRIYSGSIQSGDKIKVLGESYTPEDDEDVAYSTISSVSLPRGRYSTQVSTAQAGNWVLIDGVDASITKTATITGADVRYDNEEDEVRIFAPLKFPNAGNEPVVKLSIEPLNPSELPKMIEGLRRVSKSYPMVRTRVEESGEHVIYGTGELYLDCVMHDLRHVYSDIEIKVADPVVGFRETVVETSSMKCFAETANKRNKLSMIAEPLDEGLAEKLEAGLIKIDKWDNKKTGRYFQSKYDWDLLSARSVWAFGDSPTHGPNILMNDTLPSEVDKSLLSSCKSGIIQGFQWATREGPLCEEPVRSTKIKLLDTVLADKPIHRGAGQIIPTARKVVHSSLLTALPRLLEPIYRLEVQCSGDIVDAINPLISKRRGHIVHDRPVPGSPLFTVKAFMPVIDSFGFETDLRVFTQGQAMVQSVFDHWAVVPGDPLDRSIILHPLEPSPPQHLARDFLIKTRRRKGLSEDVSVVKFFDESMREKIEA